MTHADLRSMLTEHIEMQARFGSPFVAAKLVLDHGTDFIAAPLPQNVRRGPQKMCFMNATKLALSDGLRYVEGYGLTPRIPMPIHHAWCVDKAGRVVDNTWVDPHECVYRGVIVADEILTAEMLENEHYGLFETGIRINTRFIFGAAPELRDWALQVRERKQA